MQITEIDEAKSDLARLIERAAVGEDIIIGEGKKPVAKLVAYQPSAGTRKPGAWEGRVWMSEDFDEMLPSVTAAFRGEKP